MQWRTLLITFTLSYGLIAPSMASQLRWSLGGNYSFSSLSLTDLTDTTTTLNSVLSYRGSSSFDFEFGSRQTYYFLGISILYQSTHYDVTLTPGIPDAAVSTLGTGVQAGIAFWLLKIGGFVQSQDILLFGNNGGTFSLTKVQAQEVGAKVDFTFLTWSDWDVIFKMRYGMLSESKSGLSGSELATGLYLEQGTQIRWTLGAEFKNLSYSTSDGSIASQDLLFGITLTLPIQIAPANRDSAVNQNPI